MIFEGLSLKQINKTFFEGESPTLNVQNLAIYYHNKVEEWNMQKRAFFKHYWKN